MENETLQEGILGTLARNFGNNKSDDMPDDMLKYFDPKRVEELVTFTDVNPTNRHLFFVFIIRTLQCVILSSWHETWCLVLVFLPRMPLCSSMTQCDLEEQLWPSGESQTRQSGKS